MSTWVAYWDVILILAAAVISGLAIRTLCRRSPLEQRRRFREHRHSGPGPLPIAARGLGDEPSYNGLRADGGYGPLPRHRPPA
jgi:hypothetical protein